MKNKIDSKLEKIIWRCVLHDVDKKDVVIAGKELKHLILSEIKKVEPKKLDLKDRFYGKSEIDWGFEHAFNQAIDKYHKALEELLK